MTEQVVIGMRRDFRVTSTGGRDALDAHTDLVMDELLKVEDADVTDSAVGVDLSTCIVEIEITARGDDFDDAVKKADSAIRSAIHAAGGSTPEWKVTTIAQRSEVLEPVSV